jgi:hypothetical protein
MAPGSSAAMFLEGTAISVLLDSDLSVSSACDACLLQDNIVVQIIINMIAK